jgi:tRNA threonylcarbamoyladenosine biosynthesis protein TsaB
MKCLAANTANALLSIALTDNGKVLHSYESAETRDQGNLLLRHMRDALEKAKIRFQDLDLLAVVTGPGSFTGIRIGLATMRALSLAAKVPVIGVSSFEMFAVPKPGHTNLIAIESWREELYFQANDDKGNLLRPPSNVSAGDFAVAVSGLPGPFVISGDAAGKLAALLPEAIVYSGQPSAADVARLAVKCFRETGRAARPLPFYLREADVTMPKNRANG